NNMKSQQLGPDLAMKKKACYNCGDFFHFANDCRKKVQKETTRPKVVINKRDRVKDVQASACWVWKSVKPNSASIILKRYDYVDVRGRSSFPTSSDVFPLLEEVPTTRRKFPLPEEVPTGSAK
nr:hypothetical protein [Tanacetum cinerariifolium]